VVYKARVTGQYRDLLKVMLLVLNLQRGGVSRVTKKKKKKKEEEEEANSDLV
jgi:hypothetical protein